MCSNADKNQIGKLLFSKKTVMMMMMMMTTTTITVGYIIQIFII
jgi:hypothetical protein